MKTRTCLKCGWVHMGVTREYAENAVAEFNEYYATLPPETKAHYSGPCTLREYDSCDFCGGPHTNFRDAEPDDCPDGCTIGPIIIEESRES